MDQRGGGRHRTRVNHGQEVPNVPQLHDMPPKHQICAEKVLDNMLRLPEHEAIRVAPPARRPTPKEHIDDGCPDRARIHRTTADSDDGHPWPSFTAAPETQA